MHTDPWAALRIDRGRVPKKFLISSWSTNEEENDLTKNFEYHFKRWWNKYRTEFLSGDLAGTPAEFAEYALGEAQDEEIGYPPILLRRKKELEAA